jgi:AraC-like DNA-binding protein
MLGFIVSGILVFINKTDTFTSRLLAAFLFTFSLFALHYTLLTTNFFRQAPHLWKSLVWVSFLYMPISFIYVRSVLSQSFRFMRWDYLFFLPAIIYTASLVPFYLRTAEQKLAHMAWMAAHPEYFPLEPESIFPLGTGYVLRILLGLTCVGGQFYHLYRWKVNTRDTIGATPQNQLTYRWLFLFSSTMGIFYLAVLSQFLSHDTLGKIQNHLLIGTIIATILFVSLFLLVKPAILYGIRGWVETPLAELKPDLKSVTEPVSVPEKKKSFLTVEQGLLIKQMMESHFQQNKPYLKQGYSISELASELKIPSYQLSGFINQEYGKNFNELVNQYRVNDLIEQFRKGSNFSHFTLEAIGRDSGFNSRAAFISSFKKVTGRTPSEFFGRRGERAIV